MNTCWFQTKHTKMVVISIFAILNIEIITFNSGPTTTAEQQTTTEETTTKKTTDGSTSYPLILIIIIVCVVIGIIIISIIVFLKNRNNKRHHAKTLPDNSNKTLELTENKPDTSENMAT